MISPTSQIFEIAVLVRLLKHQNDKDFLIVQQHSIDCTVCVKDRPTCPLTWYDRALKSGVIALIVSGWKRKSIILNFCNFTKCDCCVTYFFILEYEVCTILFVLSFRLAKWDCNLRNFYKLIWKLNAQGTKFGKQDWKAKDYPVKNQSQLL